MKVALIASVLASKEKLASMLVGTFTSHTQSIHNPEYMAVTVRHCHVKVTNPIPNAIYLVVENSISLGDKPLPGRLLELTDPQDGNVSVTALIPRNSTYLHRACSRPDTVIEMDQMYTDTKCVALFTPIGEGYTAKIGPRECKRSSTGSGYVTSESEIHPTWYKLWDRIYNEEGVQVSGARDGPYQMQRVLDPAHLNPYQTKFASYFMSEFDNYDQVAANPKYIGVKYRKCPIRAEGFAPSSYAVYIEQAIAITGGTLYRRRIGEIRKGPGHDTIYYAHTLDKAVESQYANFCDNYDMKRVVPASHIILDNCAMNFMPRATDKSIEFYGGVGPGGCESNYNGAKVLTIFGIMTDGLLNVHERWWDANNNLVAGNPGDGEFIQYKRTKRVTFPIDVAVLAQ